MLVDEAADYPVSVEVQLGDLGYIGGDVEYADEGVHLSGGADDEDLLGHLELLLRARLAQAGNLAVRPAVLAPRVACELGPGVGLLDGIEDLGLVGPGEGQGVRRGVERDGGGAKEAWTKRKSRISASMGTGKMPSYRFFQDFKATIQKNPKMAKYTKFLKNFQLRI